MHLTSHSGVIATTRTLSGRMGAYLWVACCIAALLVAGTAGAVDFPVSGTMTFNGNAGDIPDGSVFAGSSYDSGSGEIGTGNFVFPQSTVTFDSPLGTAVATYVLTQTNSSSGEVWSDATAALTPSSLMLTVVSVTVGGFPFPIGTCVLGPIELELAGTASSTGLSLSDDGFTIPEVAPTDCSNQGDTINSAIAGSNNQAALALAGDFTPPADNDTIFENGFDGS